MGNHMDVEVCFFQRSRRRPGMLAAGAMNRSLGFRVYGLA